MAKKLGKFTADVSVTLTTRILQLGLGIAISVIINRALGPSLKGVYSIALLLPRLLETFGDFGLGQAAVYHIGKKRYPTEQVVGSSLVLGLVLGCLAASAGLVVLVLGGGRLFPNVPGLYLYVAIIIVPLRFLLNPLRNCLLGVQRVREYNLSGIAADLFFAAAITVLWVTLRLTVGTGIGAEILAVALTMVVTLSLGRRILGPICLRLNHSYVKDAMAYGFKVYLGNVVGFLHYRVDQFLMNIFLAPSSVGLYATAATMSEKIWLISQSAGIVLFPRVSCERDATRLNEFTARVCRNVLLITGVGAALLCLLAGQVMVLLYSDRFAGSILPFRILLIGAVTLSGWRVLSNDLYGRGKAGLNVCVSTASVALNVLLNVLWIPRFGPVGAAWASSVSYTFAFLLVVILYVRVSGNKVSHVVLPRRSDLQFYLNLIRRLR